MAGDWRNYTPATVVRCPAIKNYSAVELGKMAAELRKMQKDNPAAVTPGVVRDFRMMRDQCRAIEVHTQ